MIILAMVGAMFFVYCKKCSSKNKQEWKEKTIVAETNGKFELYVECYVTPFVLDTVHVTLSTLLLSKKNFMIAKKNKKSECPCPCSGFSFFICIILEM